MSLLGTFEKDRDLCSWCVQAERVEEVASILEEMKHFPAGGTGAGQGHLEHPSAHVWELLCAGSNLAPQTCAPHGSVCEAHSLLPAMRPSLSLLKHGSPSLLNPKPCREAEKVTQSHCSSPRSSKALGGFLVARQITQNDTLQLIAEHGNPKKCSSHQVYTLPSGKALLQLPEALCTGPLGQ